MNNDFVVEMSGQAIKMTLMLAAPMLIGAMIVGVTISIFQAVTQINEQTLSFVPKIVTILVLIIISGPWLINTMTSFTEDLIVHIPEVIRAK
ncbi:MAG: flagellar biosynthesis protein FliQ [Halobacteriovoraceae bacterium]|nr:flagellar biosynthesis protein FliQ [Halobacteriovoraceae bacterium]MCB9094200.1 flagellar biosynthesis protein FliQ [Halobacteriovoraceae bacterium]